MTQHVHLWPILAMAIYGLVSEPVLIWAQQPVAAQNQGKETPDGDLEQRLRDADEQHALAIERAIDNASKAIQQKIDKAADAGDLDRVKALNEAEASLHQRATLPNSEALVVEAKALTKSKLRADELRSDEYEKVIKAYTKAKKFGLADIVQKRAKQIVAEKQLPPTHAIADVNWGPFFKLKAGDPPYINREWKWKDVPQELLGKFYTQNAMKAPAVKTLQLQRPGSVYIAYAIGNDAFDQTIANMGWLAEPLKISADHPGTWRVRKKNVVKGEVVPVGHENTGTFVFFDEIK